jgi:mannosyltransferase OCH1-like enzyme
MNNIPKNIFQIYHDKKLIKENVKNEIIDINPNYNYKLYDFNEGIEFIKLNFDKKLSEKIIFYIQNLERYAHKSDLLRYCLLYIYGGVYLDVDLKQQNPLDNIIIEANNADFITSFGLGNNIVKMNEKEFNYNNNIYHPILCNGFLFSIPKNIILLNLIKKIITLPLKNRHSVNIYYFHDYLKKYNNNNNLDSYNNMLINDIKVYLFKEQTIEKGGKNAFLNKNNEIIMYSNNYWKKKDYLN